MNIEGWDIALLGEICSITIGGTPSRANPIYWDVDKSTGNVWVSIRDLNQRVITDTAEYITKEGIKNSNVKRLLAGTVILSFKLTIGRVAIAGKDLYTNEAIAGLCNSNILPSFLYYGLQQWDLLQGVDQAIKGATLNKQKLNKIQFNYPTSIKEQEQIAEVLSTIDRALTQTEAIIAKQQRIKTGLMQDLLTKGIDENGNIRSEATHEFKDSAIGRIPVEWEVKIIGKIASLQRGHDITEVEFIAGEYPVISSSGIIGFHNISTSNSPNVVVGRKGSIGNVYYLDVDFWAHDTSLYVTNFFGNNEKYIYYLFSYLELERFGTKSGSPSLNRNDIHPLRISLPKPSEQKLISKRLTHFDNSISNLKSNLNKLQHQKNGLMQDLLTGKIRVTNLLKEKEPASP
ncbi:restriction endonuclease subunit S [Microcoleus sp. MON1_C1]|uniref:restriction endonuclease subunit S n=1 Tax=Microcoleus sp. MON1_C1 TaxID=2818827 RepID=UPI002FD68748